MTTSHKHPAHKHEGAARKGPRFRSILFICAANTARSVMAEHLLIRELRARYPEVRIIAISGGGRRGTVQFLDVARKLGADAALAKPFTRAQITGLVRDFLKS